MVYLNARSPPNPHLTCSRNLPDNPEPVQRIRVVARSKADAHTLKQNLAAADARFKDAYVITLPRASSS